MLWVRRWPAYRNRVSQGTEGTAESQGNQASSADTTDPRGDSGEMEGQTNFRTQGSLEVFIFI